MSITHPVEGSSGSLRKWCLRDPATKQVSLYFCERPSFRRYIFPQQPAPHPPGGRLPQKEPLILGVPLPQENGAGLSPVPPWMLRASPCSQRPFVKDVLCSQHFAVFVEKEWSLCSGIGIAVTRHCHHCHLSNPWRQTFLDAFVNGSLFP